MSGTSGFGGWKFVRFCQTNRSTQQETHRYNCETSGHANAYQLGKNGDISDHRRGCEWKFQNGCQPRQSEQRRTFSLDNPRYQSLIAKYPHLQEVKMDDEDTKAHLPVHVVLGAGEYARMKTNCRPLVGRDGEPIAELTKFGWFIMSPGQEFNHNQMLMTQTSQQDYEELCRLDILGLADTPEHDQEAVYGEFREQLVRNEEGWYETGLPWRGDRQALPNNKQGSLQRLNQLTKKLQRKGMTVEYDNIITEQKNQGVVEPADMQVKGVEFYIPHKSVVREDSQTTKTRIVYDASSRLIQMPLH